MSRGNKLRTLKTSRVNLFPFFTFSYRLLILYRNDHFFFARPFALFSITFFFKANNTHLKISEEMIQTGTSYFL
ncbi:Uncharacterized protein APZ42_025672 [Daphnia magna]|uniref:Uncharacterized protein n=1 Tax=Daphnia magna TaxID=35525 RepID=A0A162DCQ0_9CRUS|nr:Uncharacterized protein APZ42_025672 [Daphnia magna]